ncbi:MAG: PH domain-containing protein [Planctomycetes bacterium]|nr:PH domain-containing protein [Planctomycetota bacterium]
MAPERGVVHRLHPASLPLELVRRISRFGFYAVVAVVLAARSEELAYLFLLLLPIGGAVMRFLSFRYELADDRLIVREGVFVKQVRQIPYARIQNLDTTQGVLHRALGVVDVRVQTAGGKEPEAVFQVISRERLEELRAVIFGARAEPVDAWSSAAPSSIDEAPLFRMRASDLAVHGLLSQKGLFVVGGLLLVLREFADRDRVKELFQSGVEQLPVEPRALGAWTWVALSVAGFALLQLATLAWAVVTLFGFRIERRGDALHSQYGLFTRHETSLPRRRIQALHVKQGLFQRLFGRVSVHAVSAGGVGGEEKEHARPWLVPTCRGEELPRLLRSVQPDAEFDAAPWRKVHPRATRRLTIQGTLLYSLSFGTVAAVLISTDFVPLAPTLGVVLVLALAAAMVRAKLVYRALAFARTDKALFLRHGVLTRRKTCVPLEKIQSVRLSQTPLDRMARMATLSIDTAGPGGQHAAFVVPYLPVREARRLSRALTREANRRDFRW